MMLFRITKKLRNFTFIIDVEYQFANLMGSQTQKVFSQKENGHINFRLRPAKALTRQGWDAPKRIVFFLIVTIWCLFITRFVFRRQRPELFFSTKVWKAAIQKKIIIFGPFWFGQGFRYLHFLGNYCRFKIETFKEEFKYWCLQRNLYQV